MKKILLCLCLTIGAFANENCSLIEHKKDVGQEYYKFQCTNVKGYDYAVYRIDIQYYMLHGVKEEFYINDVERKCVQIFQDTEGTWVKDNAIFDEYHVMLSYKPIILSDSESNKQLLYKWNYLKKFINK